MAREVQRVELDCAQLCHRVLNIESSHDSTRLAARQFIDQCHQGPGSDWPVANDGTTLADALLRVAAEAWRPLKSEAAGRAHSGSTAFLLLQNAPTALLGGCVLQNMANAASNHEHIATLAHAAHAWHAGHGCFADNHSHLYRRLLEQLGHHPPPIDSARWLNYGGLLPASWRLAAYRLSLSLFPGSHWPDILGAALLELATAGSTAALVTGLRQ